MQTLSRPEKPRSDIAPAVRNAERRPQRRLPEKNEQTLPWVTLGPMAPMPQPGDPVRASSSTWAGAGGWFTTGTSRPTTALRRPHGRGAGSRPKGTAGSECVWACPGHLEGLTGLREFGVRGRLRGVPVRHEGAASGYTSQPFLGSVALDDSDPEGRKEH